MGEDVQLGLGPYEVQEGDVVSVLLGCSSAVVLRRTHDGQYQIVDEAYYYGFMSGEALLGSPPDSFESLTCHDSEKTTKSFINREMGAIQQEDPTLGELPTPWRRMNHLGEGYWPGFMNNETSKSTILDLRLSPKILKARGVKLKTLSLV